MQQLELTCSLWNSACITERQITCLENNAHQFSSINWAGSHLKASNYSFDISITLVTQLLRLYFYHKISVKTNYMPTLHFLGSLNILISIYMAFCMALWITTNFQYEILKTWHIGDNTVYLASLLQWTKEIGLITWSDRLISHLYIKSRKL